MYYLRTLGGLSLERDGVPQDAFGTQRKTLALLTLLAVAREKGLSRDRLAASLWPESDTERSRGALKQALHVLRRRLSPELTHGTAELRLNRACIESDVDTFLGALERGDLGRAVEVYGGPFLDGFYLRGSTDFEQWVDSQRDDLARQYAAALGRLARAAEGGGDYVVAVGYWRRLHAEDPLSARTTIGLMTALSAAGERMAAIRCAGAHETLLREQLDSPADPDVMALAARLRGEVPTLRLASLEADPELQRPIPAAGQPRVSLERPESIGGPAGDPSLAEDIAPASEGRQASPPASSPVASTRIRPRPAVAVVVLVALFAAFAVATQPRSAGFPLAAGIGDRAVAVLPFANTDGDPANARFSDGLTDELIGALGKVPGLRIAARASTFALHGKGLSARAIADTLGVATVLQGAVRRESDRLKVTAQLVDASKGAVLWAGTYDREGNDLVALQQELAHAIAGALSGGLPPGRGSSIVNRPTADLEAYDLYLEGRHGWTLPIRERLERAAILYRRAAERDPNFAMAYAGLAETYVNIANFGYLPAGQALARAKAAAERALELDPGVAEAHVSYGYVLASELNFEAAEAAFRRAIELNPNYPWGHHYYSLLLLMLGRAEEALGHNRQALALDPLSLPGRATHGIIFLHMRDDATAERELRRALGFDPDFVLALHALGALQVATGALDEGLQRLEAAVAQASDFVGLAGALAAGYRRAGRPAEADAVLVALEASAGSGGRRRVNLVLAYAMTGRLETAAAHLEELEWDVPSLIALRGDPLLAGLRADPRYGQLLRRIRAAGP